jgi:hypothetical protein
MKNDVLLQELFHGSAKEIRVFEIRLDMNLLPCDFGNGFYTTPVYLEAVDWALIKNPQVLVVNIYELNLTAFSSLNVIGYEASVEWYKSVQQCRATNTPPIDTDIVIAPVATAFDIEMMARELSDSEIADYLENSQQERDSQIVFLTTKAVEASLTFKGADIIKRGEENEQHSW